MFLLDAHPELNQSTIKTASTLRTGTGSIVSVTETLKNSQTDFSYVCFIDLLNKVTVISKGTQSPTPSDPITADSLIKKSLGSQLTDYELYQVTTSATSYTFDYLGS